MNEKELKEIKIGVDFFQKDGSLKKAVGGGVYAIKLNKKCSEASPILLYIGESYCMIVRCGYHLAKLYREPDYMGLTKEILENCNFELQFEVLEIIESHIKESNEDRLSQADKDAKVERRKIEGLKRKEKELEFISDLKPATQLQTSDKQIKDKVSKVKIELKKRKWL